MANEKGYEFGHSFFIAPRIEGYTLLEGQGPRTVYPVILPEEVEIDYIEVVDKTGTLQQVRFTKDAFPNGMEGGHIHPLTIRMEGIIPTISRTRSSIGMKRRWWISISCLGYTRQKTSQTG